jgi:hypothetical protein
VVPASKYNQRCELALSKSVPLQVSFRTNDTSNRVQQAVGSASRWDVLNLQAVLGRATGDPRAHVIRCIGVPAFGPCVCMTRAVA